MKQQIPLVILCLESLGYSVALNTWELPATDALWDFADSSLDGPWLSYKRSFNKTYLDKTEDMIRRLYWEDNLRRITDHNERYKKGIHTHFLGETDFADMAEDEFCDMFKDSLKVPSSELPIVHPSSPSLDTTIPASVDWRAKGIVTPVKYQGKCGACWAFAAVGSMESLVAKKTGKHDQNFSEQNLVDCAGPNYGNNGCRGGWMTNAYKYIKDAGGIDTEACYPFTGTMGKCKFQKTCVGASVKQHVVVERTQAALAQAVAIVGPVAVAMDVLSMDFALYKGGIWQHASPACDPLTPDHAFVNVGYGVTDKGQKFWILKNSWGLRWGVKGFLYAAKDTKNDCGLALYATYPIV